jgi:type II secretory pathway pseudopilin PulG
MQSGSANQTTPPPRAESAAFTLTELLVVIGVVLMLIVTLLPAFARTSLNSRSYQCLNNHHRLTAAWRMYADENRDVTVFAAASDSTFNPLNPYAWSIGNIDFNPNNRNNWDIDADITRRPLWPYSARDASIYRCPSDESYVVVNGTARPRVRSMSMNLYLGGFAGTDGGWPVITAYRIFLKTTDINPVGPANTFVFIDPRVETVSWGNFATDMTGYAGNPATYNLWDLPGMLHDNACSFSFADGRAEIHRWQDPRTTPTVSVLLPVDSIPSPRNADVAWLQNHATRPK